jgi:hypothetical protein
VLSRRLELDWRRLPGPVSLAYGDSHQLLARVWIGAGRGTRNHKRTPSLRSLRSAHPPPRRKRHVPLRIIRRRLWRSELNSVGCAGGGVLQPRRRSPVPRVKVPPVERSFEKSRRLTGDQDRDGSKQERENQPRYETGISPCEIVDGDCLAASGSHGLDRSEGWFRGDHRALHTPTTRGPVALGSAA